MILLSLYISYVIIFIITILDNNTNLKWQTNLFQQTSKRNGDDEETCCNTEPETNNTRCTLKFCDCSVEEQIKCYFSDRNFYRLGYVCTLALYWSNAWLFAIKYYSINF